MKLVYQSLREWYECCGWTFEVSIDNPFADANKRKAIVTLRWKKPSEVVGMGDLSRCPECKQEVPI